MLERSPPIQRSLDRKEIQGTEESPLVSLPDLPAHQMTSEPPVVGPLDRGAIHGLAMGGATENRRAPADDPGSLLFRVERD